MLNKLKIVIREEETDKVLFELSMNSFLNMRIMNSFLKFMLKRYMNYVPLDVVILDKYLFKLYNGIYCVYMKEEYAIWHYVDIENGLMVEKHTLVGDGRYILVFDSKEGFVKFISYKIKNEIYKYVKSSYNTYYNVNQ